MNDNDLDFVLAKFRNLTVNKNDNTESIYLKPMN